MKGPGDGVTKRVDRKLATVVQERRHHSYESPQRRNGLDS